MSSQTVPRIENQDKILQQRIDETRRRIRSVDISLSVLSVVTILLGGLLFAVLADHWISRNGLDKTTRLGIFFLLAGLVGLFIYRRIVPLFLYPINPVFAAHLLERGAPSIKNSIINWLLLRQERLQRGQVVSNPLSQRMFDGVTRTALLNAGSVTPDQAVDMRGIVRWGVVLALLVLFFLGYAFLSPKNPLTSIIRIILPLSAVDPPQAVRFNDVRPGNVQALQGERLEISAEIIGKSSEPVYLFFSTDDGKAFRQAIPMRLPEGKTRHEVTFPPGKQGFAGGVDYWIEQGDSRSGTYRIDVRPVASLEITSLTYRFPDYTGRPIETVETENDIRAVEGTEVEIAVRSTVPLNRADLFFDNDPSRAVPMRISAEKPIEASVRITMLPDPRRPTETTIRNFSFRAFDTAGIESRRSGTFRMEIVPDKPPIVQWIKDLSDVPELELPLNATIEVGVQAEDPDFGLRFLRFHVDSENKRIRPIELVQSPADGPTEHVGSIEAETVFSPITSRLAVGDTVEIRVEAVDTKLPEPNVVSNRGIKIRVVDPKRQEKSTNEAEDRKDAEDRQDRKPEPDRESGDAGKDDASDGDRADDREGARKEETTPPKDGEQTGDRDGEQASRKEEQPGESGNNDKTQKREEKDQNGDKEPIDPETQDGDAMEKIMEQMKKEGKLPDDPADENPSTGKQEPSESESPKEGAGQNADDPNGENDGNGENGKQPTPRQDRRNGRQEEHRDDSSGEPDGGLEGPGDSGGSKNQNAQSGREGNRQDDSEGGKQGRGADNGTGSSGQPEQDDEKAPKKQETEAQPGSRRDPDGNSGEKDRSGEQGTGGGKERSPGKKDDGETAGGDQQGDPKSAPEKRPGDHRKSDKHDIPVDPSDSEARQRDDTLDPDLKDRRNQGGDATEPKKTDVDRPQDTLSSGDEGKGRETSQAGQSDRAQSATDGKKGDRGKEGIEQDGGQDAAGNKPMETGSGEKTDGRSGDSGSTEGGERNAAEADDPNAMPTDTPRGADSEQNDSNRASTERSGDGVAGKQSAQGKNEHSSSQPAPNESTTQREDGRQGNERPAGGGGDASRSDVETTRDEANLKYTEQVTNLALEYLEDQLNKKPDPELLENLGWTEEQLRAFHEKWKRMAEQSRRAEPNDVDDDAWKEALKSLGIKPSRDRPALNRARTDFKDDGKAAESGRYAPPPLLKRRFQQYTEGIGTADK